MKHLIAKPFYSLTKEGPAMKTFKAIAAALLLIALTSYTTTAHPLDGPLDELRLCVTNLLKSPQMDKIGDEKVRISFFITTDDELVVLKTDARTKSFDKHIKSRLNYQKIDVANLEVNRVIHIKVKFQTE